MTRWLLLAVLSLVPAWVPAAALAEPVDRTPAPAPLAGRRIAIDTPPTAFTSPRLRAAFSKVIYVERCRGGCTVTKANVNDAQQMLSTIPTRAGTFPISEFINQDGQSGAAADAEWSAVVQCLREVYSPFDVEVTDVKPTSGTYHVALLAGLPQEIGFGSDILGVAPLASNCSPQDNAISFSFANAHGPTDRVLNLCWTAAQESAHAFGLDHSFKFLDGRSACNDPMTYQVDCGGQRFFRNQSAKCGEFEERACKCGATQNSHTKLLSVFGAGTPITGNPTAEITNPADGQPLGPLIGANAGSKRGVAKVQLLVNGFPWVEIPGAKFGLNGQAIPSAYGLILPASLPDGISDFVVRAYDDLGAFTDSATVTRTKGLPCTSADTCAVGQKCEAGKCLWDPAVGEIGDACTYPQYCKSLRCEGSVDDKICTQACDPMAEDTCPGELTCHATAKVCYFSDDAGCCSVAPDDGLPWPHLAGFALVFASLLRRRRRR